MHAPLVASGFLLALFSSFGQTFFIALFGAEIRAQFALSHGGVGSIYSAVTLVSGLLMFWVGALLDRVSLRTYTLVATLGLAGACLVLAAAQNVWLLALALFGLRLAGQGMMSHASVTSMARAFERHRGKAIAVASLGHPAGEAALPFLAVTAAAALGWRGVWLAGAGLLVLAAALLFRLIGRRDAGVRSTSRPLPAGAPPPPASYTRAEMLRERRFYLVLPALIGPSFIITGLFFHQVHLTEVKGWELSWFAFCFTAYAVASTAGMMLAGALIDRLSAVHLMPVYLLPLGVAAAVLASGDHALIALAFMGLAGLTTGSAVTVVTSMWAEVYGTAHLGAIRALAASLMVIASALAPASLGWLIDRGVGMDAIALASAIYLAAASVSVSLAFSRRVLTRRGPTPT